MGPIAMTGTTSRRTNEGLFLYSSIRLAGAGRQPLARFGIQRSIIFFSFGFGNFRFQSRRIDGFFRRQGRRRRRGTHGRCTLGTSGIIQHASSGGVSILRRVAPGMTRSQKFLFAIGFRHAGPIQPLNGKDHQGTGAGIPSSIGLTRRLCRGNLVNTINPSFIDGQKGFGNGS